MRASAGCAGLIEARCSSDSPPASPSWPRTSSLSPRTVSASSPSSAAAGAAGPRSWTRCGCCSGSRCSCCSCCASTCPTSTWCSALGTAVTGVGANCCCLMNAVGSSMASPQTIQRLRDVGTFPSQRRASLSGTLGSGRPSKRPLGLQISEAPACPWLSLALGATNCRDSALLRSVGVARRMRCDPPRVSSLIGLERLPILQLEKKKRFLRQFNANFVCAARPMGRFSISSPSLINLGVEGSLDTFKKTC